MIYNAKRCKQERATACAEYNNWAQALYESAVKNGHTSLASIVKSNNPYVRNEAFRLEMVAAADAAYEAAKKEAALEEAVKKKAAEEEAAAKKIKEDSSNILSKEFLIVMVGPLLKQYPQLANNLKNIEIEKLIEKLTGVKEFKTISEDGKDMTVRCDPCTWDSGELQGDRAGMDLGMPQEIFDVIMDAIKEASGEESV